MVVFILVGGLSVPGSKAAFVWAEPWLSTRYAQNCAACHAPGRVNLKPADRRCTLSCQGCHVNPNGGGLRSHYGKWNEDRWLRSFRIAAFKHAKSSAATEQQHYAGQVAGTDWIGKSPRIVRDSPPRAATALENPQRQGYPLVELEQLVTDEQAYLRDGREFEQVQERSTFLEQIPEGDPYRLLEQSKTDAGGDIRWQASRFTHAGATTWRSFLMAADFGLRYRPVYRKVHLVYEARFLGSPVPGARYEDILLKANTRSLYAMVDDLPFNVFVMGGYYRPLFGNFVPDHYALAQEMISYAASGNSKNYLPLYNAVSIGTAPNVPYLNLHVIQRQLGPERDDTRGFALNTGLRFVSFGGSLNYSFWKTKSTQSDAETAVEMHSLGAAARYGRVVASVDAVSLARDVSSTDYRRGNVYTLDTYTQLWRENYIQLTYARANTASNLVPGAAKQIKYGLRSFLLPGVDLQILRESRHEDAEDPATGASRSINVNGYSGQLHVYF